MVVLVEDNQVVVQVERQKALEHQVKVLMEEQVLQVLLPQVVAAEVQVLLVEMLQVMGK
jgi:hypothetical protein